MQSQVFAKKGSIYKKANLQYIFKYISLLIMNSKKKENRYWDIIF